jgi:Tol biopolymer transport system component
MGEKLKKAFFFSIVFILSAFFSIYAQNENPVTPTAAAAAPVYKKVIYYVMQDSRDLYQIGMMDLDGKNKKLLTTDGNNWSPSISPDGDRIAFYSDRSGFSNLWVMDSDGGNPRQVTSDREDVVVMDLINRGQIGWQKEGDEIFFLKRGDLWMVDRTGETPSAITRYHDITEFKLSPDGSRFLFSREKTKRHNGMWTMFHNGTNVRQIAESMILNPAFDWGDNKTIVYFHNRGISSIAYVGTEKKFLKETFYPDNDVAWAKSGNDIKQNRIAFISDARLGPNIWVMNWDGSNEKQITEKGGFSPSWMPDGKSLLYVEENDIYRVDVDSKEKVKLSNFFRSYYPMQADIKISDGEANADKK